VLARARSLPYTSPWPRIPLSSARLSFHRSPPHPPQAPLMPPLPGCRSPPRPARCRAHPSAPSHRPETSSASPRHPNSNHYQRAVVLSWSVIFVCMILGSPSTSDHCEPPPGLLKTSMLVTIEWRPTHRPTKYHRPPSDGVPPPLRPPPVPPGRRRGACPSCRRGGHGPPHYASPGGFPCGAKVTTPPTYMTPLSVFRTPEGSYKGVGGGYTPFGSTGATPHLTLPPLPMLRSYSFHAEFKLAKHMLNLCPVYQFSISHVLCSQSVVIREGGGTAICLF